MEKEFHGRVPLHYASEKGHLSVVKYFVDEQGVDVLCRDGDGDTPLHVASLGGSLDVIKYFITEKHCSPMEKGFHGRVPLHHASEKGHLSVVKYFVDEQGVDVLCRDGNGATPLHRASFCGSLDVIKYFITEKHCSPIEKGFQGRVPLHDASEKGHISVVKYFVDEQGVDVLCRDGDGDTPLHVASLGGSLDVIKYFITEKHCSPMEKGFQGRVPLHYASEKGHLSVVKYFVDEQGVDVLCRDGDGDTPLHVASLGGSLDVIKYFITEKHCSPMEKGFHGRVPLHYASEKGHLSVVKYFVDEQGVDVLCRDGNGDTPLHRASFCGSLDVIKYFITEKHCSPMEKGFHGRVPLHYASEKGHLSVVKYFVDEQGVDVLCRDGNGATPLHVASLGGSLDVIKYFITEKHCSPMEKGFHGRVPLHYASEKGHLSVVKYFVDEQGVDVLCRDGNGATPLHRASFCGSLDVIKYFITEKHCSPMEKGFHGRVPLHYASEKGHLSVVKDFVDEQGVDVLCRDGNGDTPLHVASLGGSLDVIKYFITEKHCSPMEKGFHGRVPLHNASEGGHLSVVKYFVDEQGVDVLCRNDSGATPLHRASFCGSLDVIKYFITEKHCSPMEKGFHGRVPLHNASEGGHLSVVKYFVDEQGVDVLCRDGDSDTPLHRASFCCSLDVIKYFITEKHCSPMVKGQYSRVPLHYASGGGHLSVVKYFVDEQGVDVLCHDGDGFTPLHLACQCGHMAVVQYFVHEKNCNPLVSLNRDISFHVTAKSFRNTPLALCLDKKHYAISSYLLNKVSFGDDIFENNDLISRILEEYCVLSLSVKVYIGGHRSSGKSTLLRSMMDESSFMGRLVNIKGNTAGIIPVEFVSNHFGKVTFYDFAGHEEYHGSHETLFENTTHPVILIVTDLLLEDSHILQSLKYWLSLFMNGIIKSKTEANVIIVGSHSDLLSSTTLQSKVSLISDFVQLIPSKFSGIMYVGWIDIDCRNSASRGMTKLRHHLQECCFRIRLKSDHDNRRQAYHLRQYLMCHHSDDKAILCSQLIDLIPESDDECLSSLKDLSCLYEACVTLNTTGDIIFLKNKVKEESWIVLNKEAIISEVHGILKRIISESLSTPGIVPLSLISSKTDSFSLVIEYMLKMEFCSQINPESLSHIKGLSAVHYEHHFFFPDLVSDQRPDDVRIASSHSSYSFGWLLRCAGENFFTPRFLQILLVRLTCKFALVPHIDNPATLIASEGCRVWKNGISWLDTSYVEATVEVLDMNTAVIVVLRCKKEIDSSVMQCVKLRSELIGEILSIKGDHVVTEEFLVHPKCLAGQYPPPLEGDNLLPLSGVTKTMVSLKPSIVVDGAAGRHWLSLSELFLFEPFECFGVQILRDSFDALQGDKEASTLMFDAISNPAEKSWTYLAAALNVDRFLVEELKIDAIKTNIAKYRIILEHWSKGGRYYSELVQQLSNYSVFAGRNPLV